MRMHLAETAARLASAADAIDASVDRLIEKAVSVNEFAIAAFERSDVLAEPKEVQYRFLVRLVIAVGGGAIPPRFERIESLLEAVAAHMQAVGSSGPSAAAVVEGRRGAFLALPRDRARWLARHGRSASGSGASLTTVSQCRSPTRLRRGALVSVPSAKPGAACNWGRVDARPGRTRSRPCRRCEKARKSLQFRPSRCGSPGAKLWDRIPADRVGSAPRAAPLPRPR